MFTFIKNEFNALNLIFIASKLVFLYNQNSTKITDGSFSACSP